MRKILHFRPHRAEQYGAPVWFDVFSTATPLRLLRAAEIDAPIPETSVMLVFFFVVKRWRSRGLARVSETLPAAPSP